MKIQFDPSLKEWGRDIHDLCVIVGDLKNAPALVIESCLDEIGVAATDLLEIFADGTKRINRRQ